jgi:hypothetical protein
MHACRFLLIVLALAPPARADDPELDTTPLVGSLTVKANDVDVVDRGDRIEQVRHVAADEPDGNDEAIFPDAVLVGGDASYFCTGVLIDPRHVLTAGHCAHATRVAFGSDARTAIAIQVSARRKHPALDVALLTLARPAIVDTHARRTHLDRDPPLGAIRMIGFGVRDRLRLTGFGTKRTLDVAVDGWGCTPARATATGCSPDDELIVRGGNGNDTCLGDSGGPVFELVDDHWRLLAITSRGMRPRKVICGEGGIYVRVDRISEWIERSVK